jgi:MYXO-CTERM domain-containing protein
MKKTYKKTLVSLVASLLLLPASILPAQANGLSLGKVVGQAVLHKVSSHELPLLGSPLNGNKLMVVVPEPNSSTLIALGGFVGLLAWRLRRRPARNLTVSASARRTE